METKNKFYRPRIFIFLAVFVAIFFIALFVGQRSGWGDPESQYVRVELTENNSRESLSYEIGQVLGWTSAQENRFREALTGVQWDAFNGYLLEIFDDEFGWSDTEREIFMTHSSIHLDLSPDVLEHAYIEGSYEFHLQDSPAEVAEVLVARVFDEHSDAVEFLKGVLDDQARENLERFMAGEIELLPDLVPLPPQDVGIRNQGDQTLLVFSTTYYNIGRGNLELIADPETAGISGDTQRDVFQRIYRIDGEYRDRLVGNFQWHQEHLHYHFSDFVEYSLESLSAEGPEKIQQKSTFCVRDITNIFLDEEERPAKYRICGKETQGITVGWGDTYFQTYQDQNFNISDLPSGVYRLSFHVNPEDRFEEESLDNNQSFVVIDIDKENESVDILEIGPKNYPEFEHEHLKQNL